MYGCFHCHEAICGGGAHTFRQMCVLANIDCKLINVAVIFLGEIERVLPHAANQICINGRWGIVDVEQLKENPEDTSLLFCNYDTYEEYWKKIRNVRIIPESGGNQIIPTNVDVSREYIDSLDTLEVNQDVSHTFPTGIEQLRTLTITEITRDNITMDDMTKTSNLLTKERGNTYERNTND